MPFWNELRRRNVFKVAGAYALLAWLLVQVVSAVFPALLLPPWTVTLVTVLLIIGLPVAIFLAWAYELTPEGIKPAAQAGPAGHSGSGSRLNYVLGGLLVLSIGFIVLDRTLLSSTGTGDGQAGGTIRLAVLPCDNLSPDPNSPDFAPGIHDELLNRLALIGSLRLTSRTSVLQYSDPAARPTIPEIGASLAVDTIMECSVTHAGNSLRLTTQVIGVAEDTHLWSGSYTADMSDLDALFETQAEIAMDVANAVSVRFFADEIERIASAPTQSPEAYELYLSALGIGFLQAARMLPLLDEALAIDDEYVDAWLAKGRAHQFLAFVSSGAEVSVEMERVGDALAAAERLAPADQRVVAAGGRFLAASGRWTEAEERYRRALELGLELGESFEFGIFQMIVGHFERARETWEAAIELDPFNATAASFLMMTYEELGEDALRQQMFERGQTRYRQWPDPLDGILIALAEDDRSTLRTLDGPVHAALNEYLDAPEAGLARLRELHSDANLPLSPLNLYVMSAWSAYFGDPALALKLLEEDFALGLAEILQRTWYSAFDSVRQEPGFERLLEELGLPEYWDEYGWPTRCVRFDDGSFDCD